MRRLLVCTVLFFGGCAVGPNYIRPPVPELDTYDEVPSNGESIANTVWWEMFNDPTLVELIKTTLENNRNLRASVARIAEARATLGVVRSDLFPRLDYSASATYEGTLGEDGVSLDSGAGFLSSSWQVDLWGRIRRTNEAGLQGLLATEEAYRGLTITLVAEVANAYFLLLDLDNRRSIAEKTLVVWRERLDVVAARFDAGMVSEVDLNQAKIQVYEAEVTEQTFERLRLQTENAISVLLGRPLQRIPRGLSLQEQVMPPEIPTGLPSELLERRPDILEAERQLHAQTARIGVAQARKFPVFNLNADLGQLVDDGTTGVFNLGALLLGPLFDSGKSRRGVDVEVARAEQLQYRYEQTILSAYREVNDAIIASRTYENELDARNRQVAAAQNAAVLSWVRYEGGLTSYLEVLDLQRSLFASQLKRSEALRVRLGSVVGLYKALGGGWAPADRVQEDGP